MLTNLVNNIFNPFDSKSFEDFALQLFKYQAVNNPVYRMYLNHLRININKIKNLFEIPFLPVDLFKNHKVITGQKKIEKIFTSSGTTGGNVSKHYITNISIYEKSFIKTFEYFYGHVEDYCILALLPSYLEHENSSLIYMINGLIARTQHPYSGFYLDNIDELIQRLTDQQQSNKRTLLFGLSYALLDLAENHSLKLKNTIVMETGGMKGKRKEITREQLHKFLTERLEVETIHSEYGMTELLSQAYSQANGKYFTPPWMKIMIRDAYDPYSYIKPGKAGGINVIDLVNLYSCSFIETGDLGKLNSDGSFEVLGRFDTSDIRGCNLLIGE